MQGPPSGGRISLWNEGDGRGSGLPAVHQHPIGRTACGSGWSSRRFDHPLRYPSLDAPRKSADVHVLRGAGLRAGGLWRLFAMETGRVCWARSAQRSQAWPSALLARRCCHPRARSPAWHTDLTALLPINLVAAIADERTDARRLALHGLERVEALASPTSNFAPACVLKSWSDFCEAAFQLPSTAPVRSRPGATSAWSSCGMLAVLDIPRVRLCAGLLLRQRQRSALALRLFVLDEKLALLRSREVGVVASGMAGEEGGPSLLRPHSPRSSHR